MTHHDWLTFFDLLGEIVDLRMPLKEKAEFVRQKAAELAATSNLGEFIAWFKE